MTTQLNLNIDAPLDLHPLLDMAAFQQQLAHSPLPLPIFKLALQRGQQQLQHEFEQKIPIAILVQRRSELLDQLLIQAWQLLIPDDTHLALVAVGGYGRAELLPASDIDVLILTAAEADPVQELAPQLSPFLYLLMDMGIKVGHSVRSVTACIEESADITVITNLLEARFLIGENPLFQQLISAISPDHLWPSHEFFMAKQQEQQRRHQRFHDTAYKLEPNIKESPGGLRDIQTIGWVAKRHFGAETLHDLVKHQFLSESEYHTLMAGQYFLWQVRFILHTLAKGHSEDRLLFDYQPQVAAALGYEDNPVSLAVEQFMQHYYRTVKQLGHLNEMLLQLFQEAILHHGANPPPISLNSRFQSTNQFIEAKHPRVFKRTPFALLELFLILQQHPELEGVRATTIRLIHDHLYLIDETFRQDLRNRDLFMSILRQPRGITHVLRQMNRYGILAAYLPAFANIVGRMQYDLFHIYTVDEHTLFVIRNLRRLMVPEFNHELPRCSDIAQRIPKPELLYLAGLFHDIAKGRGGDHSQLGAEEAKAFCLQHHVSANDTKLVIWLVNHHLLMSTTSQRKDIDDLAEIFNFAKLVDNRTRLDYLYLLTVADIRATNPTLWDSWKATLLWKLYHATHHVLLQGLVTIPNRAGQIEATCRQVYALLANRLTASQVDQTLADVTDDYLFHYTAPQIAWHIDWIIHHQPTESPLIGIRQDNDYGNTEIFIHCRDSEMLQRHRFALVTTLLDQLGLNIVDAQLMLFKPGFMLDTYIVSHPLQTEHKGKALPDAPILTTLTQALARPETLPPLTKRWHKRTPRLLSRPVQIACHSHPHYTTVELQATDRPGLLAQVARAFLDCDIQVLSAKVVTLGARAEDIFYLTDCHNQPLSPELCCRLQQKMQESI